MSGPPLQVPAMPRGVCAPPGLLIMPTYVGYQRNSLSVNVCRLSKMAPRVQTEDLVDAQGVADLLGLRHRNTVSSYQKRYADMPRPVVTLGNGRTLLWLRSDIERWARHR